MSFLYEIGPTLMGVAAALLIAGYCWSRVRLASVLVMVWVSAAAVLGQMTIFPGFPTGGSPTGKDLDSLVFWRSRQRRYLFSPSLDQKR